MGPSGGSVSSAHTRAVTVPMHDATRPDRGIGLVHLVWAPLGPEPVREFLSSYRAHPPGIEHELTIVLNGAAATTRPPDGESRSHTARAGQPRGANVALTHEGLLAELTDTEHRLLVLDRPVLDLAAYGLVARTLANRRLCFLNSYSVVLCDGWLSLLSHALDEPNVGLAGATASWESQSEWIRGRARYWPYQLATLRGARRDYPRFPNPHIRTTAFAIERELLLSMELERATDKRSTYLLESGHHSITRQVQARGQRAVLTGRDGNVHETDRWAAAATYRSGGQENLLVADRRTRDWQSASPRLRRRLSRDAWGLRAFDGSPSQLQ